MASTILLVAFVLLLALAAGGGYLLGLSSATGKPAEPGAIRERDAFIEHLREVSWQHRDVSPELATIIIDEIATRQRQLPGAD